LKRTHAWANQYGELRLCTERRRIVVQFGLLALAVIVVGRLIRCAWTRYREEGRPRRRLAQASLRPPMVVPGNRDSCVWDRSGCPGLVGSTW
jgi:hypothetical protein